MVRLENLVDLTPLILTMMNQLFSGYSYTKLFIYTEADHRT